MESKKRGTKCETRNERALNLANLVVGKPKLIPMAAISRDRRCDSCFFSIAMSPILRTCDVVVRTALLVTLVILVLSSTGTTTSLENGHECSRDCSDKISKTCRYEFVVGKSFVNKSACNPSNVDLENATCKRNARWKHFLLINGKSPGPSIKICLGDTVEVIVRNDLRTEELSIHWHGIRQIRSCYMDGVSMVTQCPILPYAAFRYKFKPESAGTHFYRAHSVSQQADGIYGSLIVRGLRDDPALERTLLLSSNPRTPLTVSSSLLPPLSSPSITDLLVNGQVFREFFHSERCSTGPTGMILVRAFAFALATLSLALS